ncbi:MULTISPECIES: hypothetical protein [unclassified Sphingopyxis]|jgi:hypothetical protein|uniref:hypothetical protein n=1 Tax=unclassified Sphingopyxis TaxID=2614943 RepID=UPI0025DECA8F|nr:MULTISPECIES: hypothetical protein [unclassified Sphingopyxis]
MWRAETGHRLLSISGFDRKIRFEAHFRLFETTNIAVQFGSNWKGRLLDDQTVLEAARAAAAQYLRAQGYVREADMAAGGEGDDFREVRMAIAMWQMMNPASMTAPPIKRHGRRIVGEEC